MFGPANEVASFASNIVDHVSEVERPAPDFTSACLRYHCGVVARLACRIIAPSDHSLRIVGEEGVIGTADAWDFGSPVWIRRARPPGTPGHLALTDPVGALPAAARPDCL